MYVTGCGVTDSDTDDASLFQLCNCGVFLSDKEKRAKLLRCSDGDRSLSQCGCYYSVARIVRCKLSACLAHGVKVKFRIHYPRTPGLLGSKIQGTVGDMSGPRTVFAARLNTKLLEMFPQILSELARAHSH